jgi:tetratricopeptide (TPR) repeat protein
MPYYTTPLAFCQAIYENVSRIADIGDLNGQNVGAAASWVVIPVLCVVVALGIARFRRRWLERRRLRPKGLRVRLNVVRCDLNKMAEYLGGLHESDPAVWQPFELGLAAMAVCQWDQAIEQFRKALAKAGGSQLVSIHNQTGVCHYIRGRLDDALREFDESARLATRYQVERGKASALGNIGVILHDYGELSSALNTTSEALAIVRRIGDRGAAALYLGNVGNVHRDQGELDAALQFHEEALAISRGKGDRSGVASSLGNIGSVYCDRDELDKALARYEQALAISRETGDRRVTAGLLSNIGSIHRYRSELDEALVFHEDALALVREIGYQAGVAIELGNIGLILVDKVLHKQAVLTLAESLAILLAIGVALGQRQALVGMSTCDDQLGRDRVRELLKEAGMADGSIADVLDRIDQMRRRRPRQSSARRAPFALRRLMTGSPS